MQKKKNVRILLKDYKYVLLFCITFFINNKVCGQEFHPDNKGKSFLQLVKRHGIANLKSGLLLTGEKSDTLFVLFYLQEINDLLCIPIGLTNNKENFVYQDDYSNPFIQLRETNGILTSRMVASFHLKNEPVFVIKQILAQHIILKKGQDPSSVIYERVLFYKRDKGIYAVEYVEKPDKQDANFNWPYREGDLVF